MPTGLYSPTSTRSTPSPPPEFESASSLAKTAVSLSSTTSTHLRSRKVRNGPAPGLTPIRPTLDYSTTGSYLGGESAADNDTTTDGETFASQTFGPPKRVLAMTPASSRAQVNGPTIETQEGRSHRIAVPRQGRESPHPPGSGSRGAGPVSSSPQYVCLLPDKIHLSSSAILDARQAGEYILLALAVFLAVWKLVLVSETVEALALSALVASSFIYEYGRSIVSCLFPPRVEPTMTPSPNSSERPIRRPKVATTPQRGYIFMTNERNYRECTDNGESTALLLGPLIVASALYAAIKVPASHVLASNWHMEGPLPFQQHVHGPQTVVASRRALLQCISLNTMLLFAHMYAANSQRGWPRPENTPHQGRRILLFVGFSGFWTAVSYVAYEVTRFLEWNLLNEITRLDVVCSTFFFQTSLYVMIRLARRAFTMGEIVLVAHGATALFLEAVNISIIKQWPSIAGYVKTFREPSPLLVFQLALLPGSILIGFLLSPLLALSRHIARRPRLRLRAPHQTEQLIYRRMLAIGLAAGAVLLVGGLLGGWVRWLLGGRDPWLWVIRSFANGRRPWSRLALVSWWALLGSLSVAGWNRQLARSRRHSLLHPYTTTTTRTPTQTQFKQKPSIPPPLSEVSAVGTYPPLVPRLGTLQAQGQLNSVRAAPASAAPTRDIQAVATDLLDAADKHVPTLSRNGRRKYFHALAVLMFVPGISWDPAFTHLSFSLAFSLFTFAEYIRYFAIYPFGAAVHVFLSEFLDEKDSGTAILSHFYLLTGCALPLWLESPWRVLGLAGVIVLGVGDALASIVGKRMGTHRWFPSSGKTVEGTVAFAVSVFACNWAIAAREFSTVHIYHMGCAVGMAGLLEALSKQNDNLTIPLYMWCMMVLLPAGTP